MQGGDRVGTSVALARRFGSADTVVVASSRNYPDALAAAPLAAQLGAPLLLTGPDGLDSQVADAIGDLGAGRALLMGGTGALPRVVAEQLSALVDVERVAGGSRFDTAAQTADVVGLPDTGRVLLVEGVDADPNRGWPDALAASAFAARTGTPLLLTDTNRLPGETADALRRLAPAEVLVVGGPAAVSDGVARLFSAP